MLSPPKQDYFQTENDNSCVLKISTAKQSFLLTGDIEQPAEEWLVRQYGNALKSSLLIAPHHGSNTSSNPAFLEQVKPEIVLIPAGYRNRFSFPHQQVLQRYRQQDISWLNSSQEGAIIVRTDREKLLIEASREKYGKYWMTD
jgi:competence protein ComEC